MGFSGIGFWQLFIVLLIIVLIFGTGRLRTLGRELATMVRDFRHAANPDHPHGRVGSLEKD